jgi:hypothetical protein
MIHAFPKIEKLIFTMCIRFRKSFEALSAVIKGFLEFDTVGKAFLPNFFSNMTLFVVRHCYFAREDLVVVVA